MAAKPRNKDALNDWWAAVHPGEPEPPNLPHPGCPCGFQSGLCCAYVRWARICSPGYLNRGGSDGVKNR